MNVALLGRTHWLLDAGHRLLEQGARVPLVVTFAAEDYYRAGAADFEAFARDAGAAFMLSPDLDDPSIQEALARTGCPVAASVNVPRVLHQPALNCFELGVLNAHAGDLPRYRGNAAPNWAILLGEARVGLSVHLMEAGQLDSGAVINKTFFELDDSADITAVYAWLDQQLPIQLADAAIALANGSARPQAQDVTKTPPLRCYSRRPEDGRIDWREDAEKVLRLIRASTRPFSGAFALDDDGREIRIWRARLLEGGDQFCAVPGQIIESPDQLLPAVACGHGALQIVEASFSDAFASDCLGELARSTRRRLR